MASFEQEEKKFYCYYLQFFQRSAISGLSLGMDAPYLYRSLVFGAVCGISKKSPYVMQMLSDLSGREIHILSSG